MIWPFYRKTLDDIKLDRMYQQQHLADFYSPSNTIPGQKYPRKHYKGTFEQFLQTFLERVVDETTSLAHYSSERCDQVWGLISHLPALTIGAEI